MRPGRRESSPEPFADRNLGHVVERNEVRRRIRRSPAGIRLTSARRSSSNRSQFSQPVEEKSDNSGRVYEPVIFHPGVRSHLDGARFMFWIGDKFGWEVDNGGTLLALSGGPRPGVVFQCPGVRVNDARFYSHWPPGSSRRSRTTTSTRAIRKPSGGAGRLAIVMFEP